jgi:hypothetical protein
MAANGISTETDANPVATKLKRRASKLALAGAKRNTPNTPGYRVLNTISGNHTAYVGTATTTVTGTASPIVGHPWS